MLIKPWLPLLWVLPFNFKTFQTLRLSLPCWLMVAPDLTARNCLSLLVWLSPFHDRPLQYFFFYIAAVTAGNHRLFKNHHNAVVLFSSLAHHHRLRQNVVLMNTVMCLFALQHPATNCFSAVCSCRQRANRGNKWQLQPKLKSMQKPTCPCLCSEMPPTDSVYLLVRHSQYNCRASDLLFLRQP